MEKSIKIILVILIIIQIYLNHFYLFVKKIPIAYGLNNEYFFQTLTSIFSILENSSLFTQYEIYLLITKNNFKTEYKNHFYYLEKIYKNIHFFFIEIEENKYFPVINTFRWPMSAFYKLLLADFIPDKKAIYLDGDTLVFKDLKAMFNLDMNNKIMLGFADDGYIYSKKFGINSFNYICTGVLLIDLNKIREQNITKKFLDFIKLNINSLIQVDQTVINVVLNGKVGFLPPKFGVWNFIDENDAIRHNNYPKKEFGISAYNEKKIIKAFNNPSILHLIRKPWRNQTFFYDNNYNRKFYDIWWHYAKKIFDFQLDNKLNVTRDKNIYKIIYSEKYRIKK
jgi:lipopolysaccharide biosynthesis glycosyltransferase